MEKSLTVIEQSELTRLESIIRKGKFTFVEVGSALAKIRDSRLYRGTHSTFEEYCKEKWDFGKAYAHRLIASAKTIENLSPIGDIPKTESQARPLTHLEPKQQKEAWKQAVQTAPNGKVTARHVEQTVRKVVPAKLARPSNGMQFARMAILDLEKITDDDLEMEQAFEHVEEWIINKMSPVYAERREREAEEAKREEELMEPLLEKNEEDLTKEEKEKVDAYFEKVSPYYLHKEKYEKCLKAWRDLSKKQKRVFIKQVGIEVNP